MCCDWRKQKARHCGMGDTATSGEAVGCRPARCCHDEAITLHACDEDAIDEALQIRQRVGSTIDGTLIQSDMVSRRSDAVATVIASASHDTARKAVAQCNLKAARQTQSNSVVKLANSKW